MEIENYQKYKELKKENHIFTYTGSLNFKDVILLKELIEKILVIQSAENKQKRRVINILIEALQNTHLHGENTSNDQTKGHDCLLLLGKEQNTYFIILGNFIKNDTINGLKKKLDQLVGLEMVELRQLYLETFDRGEITDKGGASLGLLKMFIDSTKNSKYQFSNIDDQYSFFSLELKVTEK